MLLEEVLNVLPKSYPMNLNDDSVFQWIREREFYFPTPVSLVSNTDKCKFILFSAPGAVGKTSLAKYIAREYSGLYWNIGRKEVTGTSFAGELAHAVGLDGERQNEFISGLRRGNTFVVLDAFDEAALLSGRGGVKEFLIEIGSKILDSAQTPTVILTARTEMASFICDVCAEYGFGVRHYRIEYFEEGKALCFIEEYLRFQGKSISLMQKKNVQRYLDEIKERILSPEDVRAFLGYAQVLQILSRKIENALDNGDLENCISLDIDKNDSLIYGIIQELIGREGKKLDEFKNSIREKYRTLNKEDIVNSLYSKKEQLLRLQLFVFAGGVENIRVDDFDGCMGLIQEDKIRYLELLKDWLPQHVFLRDNEIMSIFSDYLFAESLLDPDLSLFAEEYKINGKGFRLPTRIFMDCYLTLNNACVNGKDIFFLDAAYRSKNSTDSKVLCEIRPINMDDPSDIYLIYSDLKASDRKPVYIKVIREEEKPIALNRVEYMSINVEGKIILMPSITKEVVIHQAFIECDELEFQGEKIRFETYGDEENVIIVHDLPKRSSKTKIEITGSKQLQVDFQIENFPQFKTLFYEFNPFFYSFDATDDLLRENIDIKQFAFGLKKALEQFRIDRYSGDPAKHKDKINARCRTGIKKKVLNFLQDKGVIYEDNFKYMCSIEKLSDLHINRESYILIFSHKEHNNQLRYAYDEFLRWMKE